MRPGDRAAPDSGFSWAVAVKLAAAQAAWIQAQVRRLAAAQRSAEPACRAAAEDALCRTLEQAARLHMAQLLRLDAGLRLSSPTWSGVALADLSDASAEPPCRMRGRGQGFLPAGEDLFAGGLAVLQAAVEEGAGRNYLCYSAMRANRMLILIGRPGTLHAVTLPGPAAAARLTGRGTLILRRQGGTDDRCTGWFEAVIRHGDGVDCFSMTICRAPDSPPAHASGRVPVGPGDLPLTG